MRHSIFEDDTIDLLARSRGLDGESLPIVDIRPHPLHPRDVAEDDELRGLADTIRDLGVLQPIHVAWLSLEGEMPGYYCLAGERRLRAAKLAGLERIPVRKLDEQIDAAGIRRLQLVENCQREDLSPLELARALKDLEDSGLSQAEIARMIGKHPGFVSRSITVATAFAGTNPTCAGASSDCDASLDVLHEAAQAPVEDRPAILASRTRQEARQVAKAVKKPKKRSRAVLRAAEGLPVRFREETTVAGGFRIVISHPSRATVTREEVANALMLAAEQLSVVTMNRGAAPESEAA